MSKSESERIIALIDKLILRALNADVKEINCTFMVLSLRSLKTDIAGMMKEVSK